MTAHLVQTGFGAFYDGLAHWALSPRDVMVVLAVAMLAGFGGRDAARRAVLLLPGAWLLGGLVGFFLPSLGEQVMATTITAGIGGLLVALKRSLPVSVLGGLAVTFGAVHGLANGSVMVAEGRERLALFGAVVAAGVVALLVAALVAGLRKPAAVIVVRVAGSWIAAIALLLLGWQLRGG